MKRALFILLFCFVWAIGICADRYWILGTGTWDGSNTANWSTTSGGAGGASVPTSSDNVFFDANSGGGTVSIFSGTVDCLTFNATGFTGTITGTGGGGNLRTFGNITLGSGMTITGLNTLTVAASATIITNGVFIGLTFRVLLGTAGATYDLGDAFSTNVDFYHTAGTLNTNNHNMTVGTWITTGSTARTLNPGSSLITLTTAFTSWNAAATNFTLNAGTFTIKITNTSNTAITFAGAGLTYNNLWFDRGASTGTLTITGANTFNDFTDDGTAAHTIVFPNSTTTVTTFQRAELTNVITMTRTGGSGTWTLSAATGNICVDYINISNSTATGGASFYAGANSTDSGGNTGWAFTACPAGGTSNMFLLFGKP